MQMIRKWTIRIRKDFIDGGEILSKTRYILVKNEADEGLEMDILELRALKAFFDKWIDPYQKDNPNHADKSK